LADPKLNVFTVEGEVTSKNIAEISKLTRRVKRRERIDLHLGMQLCQLHERTPTVKMEC